MKMIAEIQNLQSELEALQHKYDRKELILQNHERKMNQYEIYITRQASKYGRNDQEANLLIKKFQHDKFSGGIEANEAVQLHVKEGNKFQNTVQENSDLKKENEQLVQIVDELQYVREVHMKVIDKCRKTIGLNEKFRLQLEAQETMIKDLVG